MNFRLNASQDSLNVQKQALYCISQSQKFIQSKKKQKNHNRLSFQFILPQSTKQKYLCNKKRFFSRLIPLTAQLYPSSFNQGMKFSNCQYSSARVRRHKKQFLSNRKHQQQTQPQEIKKYTNILSQRKKRHQQGGIDSFWMFKREKLEEGKKTKINPENSVQVERQTSINTPQAAYQRILNWGKQSLDSLIPKNVLKNYIASKLGENFASWFLNFYQFRAYITLQEFQQVWQRFKNIKIRQSHVVTFFLYDSNADGFICPRDVFGVFERQLNHKIEKDVLKIAQFVKKNINKKESNDYQFKIQQIAIRDDWLTIKDYQMYFKKIDQPYLRATNKKDTVFSKTFAVLDHRQKVRSVRKQLNQKKSLYDELYGQITKQKKHAFIKPDDYKLNYQFLYEIFQNQQTQIFKFFCDFLFNI